MSRNGGARPQSAVAGGQALETSALPPPSEGDGAHLLDGVADGRALEISAVAVGATDEQGISAVEEAVVAEWEI